MLFGPMALLAMAYHEMWEGDMFLSLGGDDVSGWGVDQVVLRPFEYPLCKSFLMEADGPSAPGDPSPLVPRYLWALRERGMPVEECDAVITAQKERQSSVFWRGPRADQIPQAANSGIEERVVPVSWVEIPYNV